MHQNVTTTLHLARIEQQKGNYEAAAQLYISILNSQENSIAYWGLAVCCLDDVIANKLHLPEKHVSLINATFDYFEKMAGCADVGATKDHVREVYNYTEQTVNTLSDFIVTNIKGYYQNENNANTQAVWNLVSQNWSNRDKGSTVYDDIMRAQADQESAKAIQQFRQVAQTNVFKAKAAFNLLEALKKGMDRFHRQYGQKGYFITYQLWTTNYDRQVKLIQFESMTPAQKKEYEQQQATALLQEKQATAIADVGHAFHEHKKNAQALFKQKKYSLALKAAEKARSGYLFDDTVNSIYYQSKKAHDSRRSMINWIILIIIILVASFFLFK
ncbi:MAG: hypothetical protein J7621_08505 [Niastella sp.]|nr:hypothetical protein [Niastella sp.]